MALRAALLFYRGKEHGRGVALVSMLASLLHFLAGVSLLQGVGAGLGWMTLASLGLCVLIDQILVRPLACLALFILSYPLL
jgi:hypothetical protein